MKNNVKRTLLALCLVAVVMVGSIAGTIAWLTDATAPVENTFTVGDINIELDEADVLDLKIIPGKTITKDPEVTVLANSEACWLFIKVETANWSNKLTYEIAEGWNELEGVPDVYYREVAATTVDTVFAVLADDQVLVSDTLTKTEAEAMKNPQPKLTVTAYACQKENVDSAAAAWANINAQ